MIKPQGHSGGGCIGLPGPPGVRTEQFEIPELPYEYAVPMLTGWDLSFPCDDHHVTAIGAWIHDISYTYNPLRRVGRLRYKISTVLRDKDSDPVSGARYKVHVLGLGAALHFPGPVGPAHPAKRTSPPTRP